MAIHIRDINESIKLLKRVKKIFHKMRTYLPMSEVQRLSVQIDAFLESTKEVDSEGQDKKTRG